MALPPLVALKAAGSAQKALTGDIYTRRWTEVKGKGSKAKVVEHEVRVNPVGIGLGAAALGAAAVGVGVALWVMQLKITPTKTKTWVIDQPYVPEVGHWETHTDIDYRQQFPRERTHTVWVVESPATEATGHYIEGRKKGFSIEQRRGFSAGDVLESAANVVGLGAPLTAAKVIPKLFMDPWHVFKGKWW